MHVTVDYVMLHMYAEKPNKFKYLKTILPQVLIPHKTTLQNSENLLREPLLSTNCGSE